jgi:hypothetical protein
VIRLSIENTSVTVRAIFSASARRPPLQVTARFVTHARRRVGGASFPRRRYAQPCRSSMPFDLEATITTILSTGQALTFDHIVRRVTESLRTDIRLSLNELVAKGRIRRRVGGRNYPWRYQAALAPTLQANNFQFGATTQHPID